MGKITDFFLSKAHKEKRDKATKKRAVRRYEAARPSKIAGFNHAYPAPAPNERLRQDLRGLILHSREQCENNDYLKAFLGLIDRNVLGPQGIRLQAQSRDTRDGPLDAIANQKIEDAWKKWGKFGNPTVCGQHSWRSAETMIAQTVARDGNILIREFKGKNLNAEGYQIQLLEIDHLDLDFHQTLNDGGRIIMGVEVDRLDKVQAYHLFKEHPGEVRTGRPRDRVRIPASQMIHIFKPPRPSSVVGIPWAYTALRRLNLLRGFEEASLTAARAGASKMGFFETEAGDEIDPDLLDGLDESDSRLYENGNLIEDLEPGSIETLPEGMKFSGFDPAYPNGEMEPFMKVILRGAAAGLDVSYSSLANDLEGANFSSLRAGQGEERESWRVLQRFFYERVHNRVFLSFLDMSMLTGALKLPPRKLEKFANVVWRGRGWQQVNPQQESNANDTELQNGTKSPQRIVAERGEELEEIYLEIKAAEDLRKRMGLELPALAKPVNPEPNAP